MSSPDPTSPTATSSTMVSTPTTYPSENEFYTPQPGQLSEAAEIARKKQEEEEKKNKGNGAIGGAAAVAGIAGLCLVGPIVGVAAAGGAAYVAATNKGVAGKTLRASGVAASTVGSSARNFDKKHQVTAKTGKGIATGVGWVAGKVNQVRNRNKKGSSNPQSAAADLTI
jgi:hypothetical protein